MNYRTFLILILSSIYCICFSQKEKKYNFSKKVFKNNIKYQKGKKVKAVFQPTLCSTKNGDVHLFAQGRLYNSHDHTDKVLMYKHSDNLGVSWSKVEFLTHPGSFWGIASFTSNIESVETINVIMAYSVPKLFELYSADSLKLLFNIDKADFPSQHASLLYKLSSTDNGKTWKGEVLKENFLSKFDDQGRFLAFYTPVGQINTIQNGENKGRIIASGTIKYGLKLIDNPSDIYDYKINSSAFIYSDDQGETWHLSGITPLGGNEASVAEINGDSIIMIRRRNSAFPEPFRIINKSFDAGKTWTANEYEYDIPSPKCLGILYDDNGVFFYTTPVKKFRVDGWLGVSLDRGKTWSGQVIKKGLFSYSDIERIQGSNHYMITFARLHHGELGLGIRVFHKSKLFD